MENSTPPKPVKLAPRFGWFKIHRADLARIREYGDDDKGKVSIPSIITLWCVLLEIANEKKANRFEAGRGVLAKRAGCSKGTIDNAAEVLEVRLRMLVKTINPIPGSKQLADSTYEIFPTGRGTPSANNALPPVNSSDTPITSKKANHLGSCLRTSSLKRGGGKRNTRGSGARRSPAPSVEGQSAAPGREESEPRIGWTPPTGGEWGT